MATPLPRRRFLAAATSALAVAPFIRPARGLAASQPVLRLGLVADAQYADAEPAGTRFYRQSLAKLTEAVTHFNRFDLGFCVNLGDLVDRDWRNYDAVLASLAQSRHPVHHVLGNHDFEVASEDKSRVPTRLGLPQRYHALEYGAWCAVILDTNEVSLYAHPAGTPPHAQAAAVLEALAAAKAPNAQTWNGAVSDRQLQWFSDTCRSAAHAGRRVIVFAHHPVFPEGNHNVWNSPRLLDVLDRNRNVVAWFNGHNHAGAFGLRDAVPFVTLKGMVETRDTNAYAVLNLHEDHFELAGQGREISREWPLRTAHHTALDSRAFPRTWTTVLGDNPGKSTLPSPRGADSAGESIPAMG